MAAISRTIRLRTPHRLGCARDPVRPPRLGELHEGPDPAAPARASLRARAGRPLQGRDAHAGAFRSQSGRARAGAGARLGRDDRRVERDPPAPRRGHAATSRPRGSLARACTRGCSSSRAGSRPSWPMPAFCTCPAATSRCRRCTRAASSAALTRLRRSTAGSRTAATSPPVATTPLRTSPCTPTCTAPTTPAPTSQRHEHIGGWIERVEAQPGFENDLEPLPAHASARPV